MDLENSQEYQSLRKASEELIPELLKWHTFPTEVVAKLTALRVMIQGLPLTVKLEELRKKYKETGICEHQFTDDKLVDVGHYKDHYQKKCLICGEILDEYEI